MKMEKCKFCQEELEEGVTLCPACGKDNQEEPAAEVGETVVLSGEETVPAEAAPEEITEATPEETAEATPEEPEAKPGKKASPALIAAMVVMIIALAAAMVALVIGGMDKTAVAAPDADNPT